MEEGQVIQHPLISRAIERAQRRVEGYNFDIRKQLLEYDNVMNQQREVIYEQRRMVLEGENLKEHIAGMLEDILNDKIDIYLNANVLPEEWDYKGFGEWLYSTYSVDIFGISREDKKKEEIRKIILDKLREAYEAKEIQIGADRMRSLEKVVMLQIVDAKWKDHLYAMDDLRGSIGLRGYGQRDPLVAYKKEGYEMFAEMIHNIKEELTEFIFKVQQVTGQRRTAVFDAIPQSFEHSELDQFSQRPPQRELPQGVSGPPEAMGRAPQEEKPETYKRTEEKVGRNDPCPCGSGKKYKKCCGR